MTLLQSLLEWFRSLFNKPQPPAPPLPPIPPVPPMPPGPSPVDPMEAIKNELLSLHNAQRAQKGTSPLARNASLDRAAQKWNDWMVSNGRLTHGSNLGDRVKAEGYNWNWVGENIAEGQRNAQEVMNSWMNSSGHRANILNNRYRDVGFGVTKDNRGTWWWTVDFGA